MNLYTLWLVAVCYKLTDKFVSNLYLQILTLYVKSSKKSTFLLTSKGVHICNHDCCFIFDPIIHCFWHLETIVWIFWCCIQWFRFNLFIFAPLSCELKLQCCGCSNINGTFERCIFFVCLQFNCFDKRRLKMFHDITCWKMFDHHSRINCKTIVCKRQL